MKLLVLGGGASGMMAALTAAACGAQVTLLERQARVGKKLLATGNGRCNLTNVCLAPDGGSVTRFYHGQSPAFALPALTAFDAEKTLEFFRSLGLLTVAEPGGRVYPLSDQANSVLDVLRYALEQAGVELRCGFDAVSLRKAAHGYTLRSADGQEEACRRLIVAAGGCAGTRLGGTTAGYALLGQLGHTRTELRPSLAPVRTELAPIRGLKGVRADAVIRLTNENQTLASASGEVQFTEFGVSGPAVFDLSRAARAGMTLTLDLLRGYGFSEVRAMLEQRAGSLPELSASELLAGMLHPRLGRMLVKAAVPEEKPIKALTGSELDVVCTLVKRFSLNVTGVMGFESAQVTAGGVRTSEFDPRTLESRLAPGVYACGEVLDIDGDCGGFNLQWAWSSGHLAALSACGGKERP